MRFIRSIATGRALAASALALAVAAGALGAAGTAAASQARSAGRHQVMAPMTRVQKIKIGGGPAQMAIDGELRVVWVADSSRLVRISQATRKVTGRLKIPAGFVAVDPKTRTVWAIDSERGALVEISEKTSRVIHRYPNLPGSPNLAGLATDSRTGRVWVSTFGTLDEISEASHRLVRAIPLRGGNSDVGDEVAVDPARNMIFVDVIPGGPQSSSGWISQINGSTGRLVRNYGFSESVDGDCCVVLAVDSRHGQVWAGDQGDASIISEARHRVVRVLSITPNGPWSAITIDTRHKIVLIGDGNDLLTVSGTSGKILRKVRLTTAGLADAVADVRVDQGTGTVYAALLWDGAVAVLKE